MKNPRTCAHVAAPMNAWLTPAQFMGGDAASAVPYVGLRRGVVHKAPSTAACHVTPATLSALGCERSSGAC